jgi:shikimate kinase
MRIYLVGYMASGKSNIGRLLAEKLGYDFLDLDHVFEERYRISVPDFFDKYDEKAFRYLERLILHDTVKHDNVVIATGGGTPCFFNNMQFIRKSGFSVYLSLPVQSLVKRLAALRRKRPLLKHIPASELAAKVTAHLAEREQFYNLADIQVPGEEPDLELLIREIWKLNQTC